MNQKGFATVLGLCLIMAIALCVKGIQESEMNHAYATTDFKTEIDLQNAAESGIYAAAEKIHHELTLNKDYLPRLEDDNRSKHKIKVISKGGDISVDVWAERVLIFPYKVNYSVIVSNKYRADKIDDGKEVCIFFSRAEINVERIGRKLYRQASAYVEINADGNSNTTIHFIENASEDIFYKPLDPTN